MPQKVASTKRTKKAAGAARGRATSQRRAGTAAGRRTAARTAELSEDVLRSLEDGQRAAIDAVHGFVDKVDRTLPALPYEDGHSRRQEIIDSALEMTDRLVHAQYDFIRRVIDSTSKSLAASGSRNGPRGAKGAARAGAAKRSTAKRSTAKRPAAKRPAAAKK